MRLIKLLGYHGHLIISKSLLQLPLINRWFVAGNRNLTLAQEPLSDCYFSASSFSISPVLHRALSRDFNGVTHLIAALNSTITCCRLLHRLRSNSSRGRLFQIAVVEGVEELAATWMLLLIGLLIEVVVVRLCNVLNCQASIF